MIVNIEIWQTSIIYGTACKCTGKLSELNKKAVENMIIFEFDKDHAIIYGAGIKRKSYKVKSLVGSPENLCNWIDEKIKDLA